MKTICLLPKTEGMEFMKAIETDLTDYKKYCLNLGFKYTSGWGSFSYEDDDYGFPCFVAQERLIFYKVCIFRGFIDNHYLLPYFTYSGQNLAYIYLKSLNYRFKHYTNLSNIRPHEDLKQEALELPEMFTENDAIFHDLNTFLKFDFDSYFKAKLNHDQDKIRNQNINVWSKILSENTNYSYAYARNNIKGTLTKKPAMLAILLFERQIQNHQQ